MFGGEDQGSFYWKVLLENPCVYKFEHIFSKNLAITHKKFKPKFINGLTFNKDVKE